MPTNKEFTIRLEDRPGTLGKLCQALAEQSVNILAFQSQELRTPHLGQSSRGQIDSRSPKDGLHRDASTNATMLLLGVADASKAAKVLEQAAAASSTH